MAFLMIRVGQDIYIDSSFYISHGEDDVVGGLAKITHIKKDISAGKPCLFVVVEEDPNTLRNWSQHLVKEQKRLKKDFGNNRAYQDPDYSNSVGDNW